MKVLVLLAACLCLLLPCLFGCATVRDQARLYTLTPLAQAPAEDLDLASVHGLSVAVGPVVLPARLRGQGIMVRQGDNQVTPAARARWAAPPEEELAGVLIANLAALLDLQALGRYPSPAGVGPDIRVSVEVLRFSGRPGDDFVCEALWTLRGRDKALLQGRLLVREPMEGRGMDAYVAAASRAALALSRRLARALASFP